MAQMPVDTQSTTTNKENKRRNNLSAEDSDDDDNIEHLQYKIAILGDGAVGKTSITNRFSADAFTGTYKQTIGIDFFIKHIVLNSNVHIALQLWDIGGQNLGSQNLVHYIYGAHVILVCYDITNYQSFCDVSDWVELIRSVYEKQGGQLPYIALVGNKLDLQHMRAVKPEKVDKYCADAGIHQFGVSAKTGEGINGMFYKVSSELAGVVLSRQELESLAAQVQSATVVNYAQHDSSVQRIDIDKVAAQGKQKKCVVM